MSRINYNPWYIILTIIDELSHIPNLTVMIVYCFHNNNPIHFTVIKSMQMIDLKFAFQSMIDRSGFDRSDWSFSRIVWPLPPPSGHYCEYYPNTLSFLPLWVRGPQC